MGNSRGNGKVVEGDAPGAGAEGNGQQEEIAEGHFSGLGMITIPHSPFFCDGLRGRERNWK